MNKIQIIILIMSLVDLTCSFFYVNTFHTKFPSQDPTVIEANPILKYSMKQFGIKIGMLFGGAIVFGLLLLLTFRLQEKYLYYLAGAFTMMIIYHFLNFRLLRMS